MKRDLMGHKSGYLEVVGPSKTHESGRAQWECQCVCGKRCIVSIDSLTRKNPKKNVRSCGCKREFMHTQTVSQRVKDAGTIGHVLTIAKELADHINLRKAMHVPFTTEVHRLSEELTEA